MNALGAADGLLRLVHRPSRKMAAFLSVRCLPCNDYADVRSADDVMHAPPSRLPRMIKLLLNAGADPNLQAADGCTPLMLAALHGKASAAAALAAADADTNTCNKNGQTPLHYAALGGHLPTVRVLLAAGAAPGAADAGGFTPLMAATKQAGNVQMVVALLDAGAPPNAFLYPASHAFTDDDAEAWEREGGEHRGNAEGEDAAIDGQAAASKVGAGAGSGAGSGAVGGAGGVGRGKTALHFACEAGGTIDVAAALLQHGAEAEVPDDVGVTPLMVAAGLGHVELVQLLLQAGANVDAKQSGGATALMLAVKCNKPEVLWVLLEAGA